MDKAEIIRKLKLDKAKKVLIIGAPEEFLQAIAEITYVTKAKSTGEYDFIHIFNQQNRIGQTYG